MTMVRMRYICNINYRIRSAAFIMTVILIIFFQFLLARFDRKKITPYFEFHKNPILRNAHLKLDLHRDSNPSLDDKKGRCGGMVPPISLEQKWLPVDSINSAYVFSAYVDTDERKLTVIGTQARELILYCQYWNMNDEMIPAFTSEPHPLKTTFLGEHHNRKYKAVLYNCPWKNATPTHISVATNECGSPLHLLRVVNSSKRQTHKYRFTACLKPLHFRYGRAYELIEWIELNRRLGTDKFVVYNYSIASNADQVLRYYSERGLVDIVQWHLPMLTHSYTQSYEPEIHSIGMIEMLQDCCLRYRQYSKYVINEDVDEVIIPHGDNITTWDDMFKSMPPDYDVYLFRNTFFRKEWNKPFINHSFAEQAKRFNLTTLRIFQREQTIFPPNQRSKYIVRTDNVGQLHIHNVLGKNIRVYKAPTNVGLLHHYRNFQRYNDQSKRVTETIVHDKYGEDLVKRVENIWKDLPNVTMYIPYK